MFVSAIVYQIFCNKGKKKFTKDALLENISYAKLYLECTQIQDKNWNKTSPFPAIVSL